MLLVIDHFEDFIPQRLLNAMIILYIFIDPLHNSLNLIYHKYYSS